MTYQDLLNALRIINPDADKLLINLPPSMELIKRLENLTFQAHREWENHEIKNLFRETDYDLKKEIPCRHCR